MRKRDVVKAAHDACSGFLYIACGTMSRGHHPVEEKIVAMVLHAYRAGFAAGRGWKRKKGKFS